MKDEKLSADTLKEMLWESMVAVQKKKMPIQTANSLSNLASKILGTVRTEIQLAKMTGKKMPDKANKFLT